MKYLLSLITIVLYSCSPTVRTSEDLLERMKAAYGDSYLSTLSFTQQTVHTNQDGTKKEETWYESMKVPGDLSIRFDPVANGNGILFTRDSVFSFEGSVPRVARPMIHPLLLLGFDVYVLPVRETLTKLEHLGYDLTVLSEGTWQERPVYIVGAPAGDDSTKQFWVDKERLVLVRTLEPQMRMMMEVQFNAYEKFGSSWVSTEVLFLRDGKVVTEEYYSDIKTNMDIDEREFDPEQWPSLASGNE